jgi:cob(I)alamin adenosyltransferase
MPEDTTHGLVVVYTGDGKGKTTAALGQAMRAVGHGYKVALIQFVKQLAVGEHAAARRLAPELEVRMTGIGFVIPGKEPTMEKHRAAAQGGLAMVREALTSGRYRMVVADELLTAVGLSLLARADVEGLLDVRPPAVHLVITGRGAWDDLVRRADLVTEMHLLKHPYGAGVPGQAGIEF